MHNVVQAQINSMIQHGIIEPSSSPYSYPITIMSENEQQPSDLSSCAAY
jgi:hypothetical protein